MLTLSTSTQFRRDVRRCAKRGYDIDLLDAVISTLRIPKPLADKNHDHDLSGNFSGWRECHILPDWLLVYKVVGTDLLLDRTGTHADLFGK
jgi:mRNA interferase YafQ